MVRAAIIRQAHDPEYIEGHGAGPYGDKNKQSNRAVQAGLFYVPASNNNYCVNQATVKL
jgi:hypothetical protein